MSTDYTYDFNTQFRVVGSDNVPRPLVIGFLKTRTMQSHYHEACTSAKWWNEFGDPAYRPYLLEKVD